MISEETIKLAAKWWRNKFEKYLNDEITKLKETRVKDKYYYCYIKIINHDLNNLNDFENKLSNQIAKNIIDDSILLSSKDGSFSTELKASVLDANLASNILISITMLIINDRILLFKYPCLFRDSMLNVTDANDYLNIEDWH